MEELEQGQLILGTTGLEDRLQENVHQCIEEFRRAQIKVWMITGDKLETAESVGVSCRLLQDEENRLFLTAGEDDQETVDKAQRMIEQVRKGVTVNSNNSHIKQPNDISKELVEETKKCREEIGKSPLSSDRLAQSNGNHSFLNHSSDSHTKSNPQKAQNTSNRPNSLSLDQKQTYIDTLISSTGLNSYLSPSKTTPTSNPTSGTSITPKYELILEGRTLGPLLSPEHKEILLSLLPHCSSIIV